MHTRGFAAAVVALFVVTAFGAGNGISLPKDPGPVASYAAAEIRDYVKRATGEDWPVVTNAAVKSGVAFAFVEDKNLGEEGFRLTEKDGVLTITASKKRGVLYGAYDYLERFVGVRWLAADTTRVPKRAAIVVPAGLKIESKPDFRMRSVYWYDYVKDGDFAARRSTPRRARTRAASRGS